jgi:hypothetical protein
VTPTTCDLRIQLREEIRIGRIVAPFASSEVCPTLRRRGMDSNFQYAGAVNLIVAPLRSP